MDTVTKDRIKPRLVRAWFDTVLNPIIRSLKLETELLCRNDFTWRTHNQRFASLVPIRDHVNPDDLDNLDQFLSIFPGVNDMISDHDNKLDALGESVRKFASFLAHQRSFLDQLRDLSQQSIIGPTPISILNYAVEYVVNSVTHLPSYYSASQVWNMHGTKFLELRKQPGVLEQWELVESAKTDFLRSVADLLNELTKVRSELSFELDVPIVASVAS